MRIDLPSCLILHGHIWIVRGVLQGGFYPGTRLVHCGNTLAFWDWEGGSHIAFLEAVF